MSQIFCEMCGQPMQLDRLVGSTKKYCSSRCKHRAYRQRCGVVSFEPTDLSSFYETEVERRLKRKTVRP